MKRILSVTLAIATAISSATLFTSCVKFGNNNSDTVTTDPQYSYPIGDTDTADETAVTEPISTEINPLTGLAGYESGYTGQKCIGIVVENSPDARPQWGLSTPDVVFEYEVEGGISRMLWLYANASRIPEKVGPLRSARHDVVELALGYDLFFVHCGCSTYAKDKIAAHPELAEVDANNVSSFTFRETTRNVATEHRLCVVGSELASYIYSSGYDMTVSSDKSVPFNFVPAGTKRNLIGSECNSFAFSYSSSYNYQFAYNQSTGLYECSLNGNKRVDDQGIQCAYSNVIVLLVDMERISDYGHQDLFLERGGRGYYLNGGVMEEISWIKSSDTAMLKMYSADGNELQLNCGTSYIGLVRSTNGAGAVG